MNKLNLTIYGPADDTTTTPICSIPIDTDLERELNARLPSGTIRRLGGKRFTWEKLEPIQDALETREQFVRFTGDAVRQEVLGSYTWSIEEDVDVKETLEYFLYSTGSGALHLASRALIYLADSSVWLSKKSASGSIRLKEKAASLR